MSRAEHQEGASEDGQHHQDHQQIHQAIIPRDDVEEWVPQAKDLLSVVEFFVL